MMHEEDRRSITVYDCISDFIMDKPQDFSHVTFFIEKRGLISIPFQEFRDVCERIPTDERFLNNYPKIHELLGDNFYFVSTNGSIIYNFKPIDNGCQSRILSPHGNFNTWERLDQTQREDMLRNFFRENERRINL